MWLVVTGLTAHKEFIAHLPRTQSMKLSIEINMDNDAFQSGDSGIEVARILHKIAVKSHESGGLEIDYCGEGEQNIHDINGNKCGHWIITDMPEFDPAWHD